MEIFINNELIDFSLEQEKNLNDILKSLNRWAKEQNYILMAYTLNKDNYSLWDEDSTKEENIPLEEELTIHALILPYEIYIKNNTLKLSYTYFSILANNIKQNDNENYQNAIEEFTYIKELLIKELENWQDYNLENLLPQNISETTSLEITTLLKIIERIKEYIIWKQTKLIDSSTFKKLLIDKFISFNDNLSDIVYSLHHGQPALAMSFLSEFFSYLYDLESLTQEYPNLKEKYQEFQPILTELEEAIQRDDIILISDLLEYEISPLISTVIELLEGKN